jgi:H+/Cl- antiporter ClcA
MLFTAVTLGAGYKGGEIVPSFCIGATFGYLFGNIIGFSPSLCAAVGMVSVFCGVTNSPLSSLLISFELFGYEGMPYYLLAIAFSYMLSGYFGLYNSQKIMYSKYKTNFINRRTR